MKRVLFILGIAVVGCIQKGEKEEITMKKYPEVGGVVVFDSCFIKWEKGYSKVRRHRAIKILTEEGVKEFSKITIRYLGECDSVRVTQAKMITPKGEEVSINIQDKPVFFQGIPLPGVREIELISTKLQPNFTIEYELIANTFTPPTDSIFEHIEVFEDKVPIKTKYLEVSLPKVVDIKWKVTGGIVFYKEIHTEEEVKHVWEAHETKANLNGDYCLLLITSNESWQDVSEWYLVQGEKFLKSNYRVLNELVSKVVSKRESLEERVKKIYSYVTTQISSPSTPLLWELGGVRCGDIEYILKTNLATQRDKSLVFWGMLRVSGVSNCYIGVIKESKRTVEEVPLLRQFNYPVVMLKYKHRWLLLDPHSPRDKFFTPYQGDYCILICKKGVQTLYHTQNPETSHYLQTSSVAQFDEYGWLNYWVEMRGKGIIDKGLRLMVWLLEEEEIRRMFLQPVQEFSPQAELDSIVTEVKGWDFDTTFSIKFHYIVPDFHTTVGKDWYVGGGVGVNMAMGFGISVGISGTPTETPIVILPQMKIKGKGKFCWVPEFEVEMVPEKWKYEDEKVKLEVKYFNIKKEIRYWLEFEYKGREIERTEKLDSLLYHLNNYEMDNFLLKEKG